MSYGLEVTSGNFLLLTSDSSDNYQNVIDAGTDSSVTLNLEQDLLYLKPISPSSGNHHIVTAVPGTTSGSNTTVSFFVNANTTPTQMDYIVIGKNSSGTLAAGEDYGLQIYNAANDVTMDSRRFEFNKGFEPDDIILQGTLKGDSSFGSSSSPTFKGDSDNYIAPLGTYLNMNWSTRGAPITGSYGTGNYAVTGVCVSNGATSSETNSAESGIFYLDRRVFFYGMYQARDQWTVFVTGQEFTS